MELSFLPCTVIITLLSISEANSAEEDWDDIVVTKVDVPVNLSCSDWPLQGSVKLEWLWKPVGQDTWSLVLSANQMQEFRGGASKADMHLADAQSQRLGDFSLYFKPRANDAGLYSCLTDLGERRKNKRVTLLAILTVAVSPSLPVPNGSTLRLITEVVPSDAVSEVAWFSPQGLPLRSETFASRTVVCKLPQFGLADEGDYTCQIRPRGKVRSKHFLFTYRIMVDVSKSPQFSNLSHGTVVSTACLARTPVRLPCSSGDYVLLYWQHPDLDDMELIFSYDRWRRARIIRTKSRLSLTDQSLADSGKFSFLLEPELKDAGVYRCEVFLNDNVFVKGTSLSVLKVHAKATRSTLVLWCQYTQRSQVRRVSWMHQNQSYKLNWSSPAQGRLKTDVPLPPRPEVTGNYTCTLELKNGKVIRAVYTVTPPPAVNPSSSSPSVISPLSGLGLLVPLVAVPVGVLLWKRGHHRARPLNRSSLSSPSIFSCLLGLGLLVSLLLGMSQSVSHHSGELENVYENPEDLRQMSGQNAVYMDLKPTNDDDVYRELDRYEQCPC